MNNQKIRAKLDKIPVTVGKVERSRVIGGEKIDMARIDELGMSLIIEIFTHVMHAQYADFFESGLAKAPSPKL